MGDLRQYILMRNDLQSMVPGRCMAQAAHAANTMVHQYGSHVAVKEWAKQTDQGFGTTIVLAACEPMITAFFRQKAIRDWIVRGWVIDPDYVIRVTHEVAHFMRTFKRQDIRFIPESADERTIAFTRAERTCAYILGEKTDFPQLADWPLY